MPKGRPTHLPDWAPVAAWFLAATPAQGLWYFPASSNWLGVAVSAAVTIVFVALAVMIQARHSQSRERPRPRGDVEHLLRLLWEYPLRGREQRSWAVKEGAVLQEQPGTAQENPGLGVAIVTTELALLAFGRAADSRIASLIDWALESAEPGPPNRLFTRQRDGIGYTPIESTPDLRHTFAFAIVLLRAKQEQSRTAGYIRLAVQSQAIDGGWPEADPTGDRALFATLYGAELLSLAPQNPFLSRDELRAVAKARVLAFDWIIRGRMPNGLWSTGGFRDSPWDGAVATAWVMHRRLSPPRKLADQWHRCEEVALAGMIESVEQCKDWRGVSEALLFRVEARVAGTARRMMSAGGWSTATHELAGRYMGAWAIRVRSSLHRLDEAEVDLATAVFALWGLAETDQLNRLGRSILAEEGL